MAAREPLVGQYVTKSVGFGGCTPESPSINPRWHGYVLSEYSQNGRGGRLAKVLMFPSGRIEEILKSRIQPLSSDLCDREIFSHIKFPEYKLLLNSKLKENEQHLHYSEA